MHVCEGLTMVQALRSAHGSFWMKARENPPLVVSQIDPQPAVCSDGAECVLFLCFQVSKRDELYKGSDMDHHRQSSEYVIYNM